MESALDETTTVGELIDALGQRAHGTVLLLLAVPNLIPIPIVPASTTIFGALIALVAIQLIVGRPTLYLPARVRAYRVTIAHANTWLARAEKLTGQLAGDGACQPDNPAETTVLTRCVGVLALVHGMILALPIPLLNFLPALGVACLGAGLARCRRRPLVVALAITAVTLVILAFASRWLAHLWRR